MVFRTLAWYLRPLPRRPFTRRWLTFEWLEDRTVCSASPLDIAPPLVFDAYHAAHVSHFLTNASEVNLYAVTLESGDVLDSSIHAQGAGSGVSTLLRIFDGHGTPLALNNQDGGDPRLRFQAATGGRYVIGVSSAPNNHYDPSNPNSVSPGETVGFYSLDVHVSSAPLLPDLTGSSFRIGTDLAGAGDSVPVSFVVENRGGADPGSFQVQVLLADDHLFGASTEVLETLQWVNATGRTFASPAHFSVQIPSSRAAGPAVLGLRILPGGPDAGVLDKGGVHRGSDFEPLTIVTLASPGATDLSAVDASLRTAVTGSLSSAAEVDTYSFSVVGNGILTAAVTATNIALRPRLTLAGPSGEMLIQSDSGRLVHHLVPGDYTLVVSAQSGTGGYRLRTAFAEASVPYASLPAGRRTFSIVTADLNRDGILDLVTPNRNDNTLSVFLGNGDSTFRSQQVLAVGNFVVSATIADVNNDGSPDLLVANKGEGTVGVLLGNGDGTFGPQQTFDVGSTQEENGLVTRTGRVGGVTVADFNGDGKPDFAASNYRDATVSVLLGNGDGTFEPQEIFEVAGRPGPVQTADVNGDGRPDLITPNYTTASVSVLLGIGDGTFQPRRDFDTGTTSYSVATADLNGDGRLDLAVSNYGDSSISVLLGNGDGAFAPQHAFATGTEPYSVALADLNGDGKFDIVAANFGDNSVTVLLGKGDGSFQDKRIFPVGQTPRIAVVGDVNGDGIPDIIAANRGDNNVTVLLGKGDGTFPIQDAAPAPAPGVRPISVASADFNGDGLADLVVANRSDNTVGVLLRNADGSLQTRQTFPAGPNPNSVVVADFDGDGVPDLVVANYTGQSVSVLVGNGDGTFRAPQAFAVGHTVFAVAAADLNGDGKPDIVSANKGDKNVSVLLGRGDGDFDTQVTFDAGNGVDAVTIGDLNFDHKPDLVVSNFGDDKVGVLLGNGDGTFKTQAAFAVVKNPSSVAIGDVNGDGKPDLLAANYGDNSVSVLLGDGFGGFGSLASFATDEVPNSILTGDFNLDGFLDVVTANTGGNSAAVLLGNGDGTFQPFLRLPAGTGASSVAAIDINNDGNLDLAVANDNAGTVSVIKGNGNGAFQPQQVFTPGKNRYAVAVADINGDGKPDLVSSSMRDNVVNVRLGNGAGAFVAGVAVPVGSQPTSVVLADLNRDGRRDLIATNSDSDSVSIALGNGDGSFNDDQTFAVGRSPRAVAVADVNGDGILDLSVSNYNDGTLSVLLGRGDGTFNPQHVVSVGGRPYALAVSDVSGDGKPDLIVANSADRGVSVLLGNGDGTFQTQQTFDTGRQPFSLALADVNRDGMPDVITANAFDNTLSVLLGIGAGAFGLAPTIAAESLPLSVGAADVNGDTIPDLITANNGADSVSIYLGIGNGLFQPAQNLAANQMPTVTLVADVNGDGRPDLVTVGNHDNTTGVLLSKGAAAFLPATAATDVGLRDTPLLVDLDGDGLSDSAVLDRSGNILFRKSLGGASNSFAPPVILNPDRPARDMAILRTGAGLAIAAADARFDAALSTSEFVFTVSLYTIRGDGTVDRRPAFSTTALPARLSAADLTGDGLDDLITVNPLDNSVSIAYQTPSGRFTGPITVSAGVAPSDIAVADMDRDDRPDVMVSNQASGDVSVLLNDATHSFARVLRFRAGTQPNTVNQTAASPTINSLAQSTSLAAGEFTGDGQNDIVVVNRGAHSFTVLAGNGNGGFDSPRVSLSQSTSDRFTINERPGAVATGDFNRDGRLDLAVLMEDAGQLWIFTGDGDGTFRHTFSIQVGDQATGLSVIPAEVPGLLDLLVGNGFGDVLHLAGKGDGTFQITGKRVSLSVVADLLGPGLPGVLVGNQEGNRVTVQSRTSDGIQFAPVQTLGSASPDTQMAPGDVNWFMLARNATLPDAVVVSSGSNALVVYRTTGVNDGVPNFAPNPQTYFVGTAPESVTVADINGDGVPDMLVANRGSNNVSVVFGTHDADGYWVGSLGPRLKSGGNGPIAVGVRDLNGDRIPDLVATNGGNGAFTMLTGVGLGFFDDRQPLPLFDLGTALVQPPTYVGDTGVGYAVTAAGDLVRFDLTHLLTDPRVVFGGQHVLVAQALPTGQVVVALADGSAKVLSPQGDNLVVTASLWARTGLPPSASSIEVVQRDGGKFDVLISSQGSDTIFVFAPERSSGASHQSPEHTEPPGSGAAISAFGASTKANVADSAIDSLSGGASGSANATAAAASANSAPGLSLSSFSSPEGTISGTATAVLVSMQGNAYSTVAVLDFGSEQDEEAAGGVARDPSLATRYPIGDTSAITRLVIGQDEALREFRRQADAAIREAGLAPLADPWREDLFFRHPLPVPPIPDAEEDDPMGWHIPAALPPFIAGTNLPVQPGITPRAMQPILREDRNQAMDGAAVLLAGMLLPLALSAAPKERDEEVPTDLPPREAKS